MSGFGYRIVGGQAERVMLADVLAGEAELRWAHLPGTDEATRDWLRDVARLEPYAIAALTAAETRPRCERYDRAALLNLRGRPAEAVSGVGGGSDPLVSVRIWGMRGLVVSVTRRALIALAGVETQVRAGEVRDPGDLIVAFATAITSDLDPVVAALGDEVDACEEQLDANSAFELRRTVGRARVTAIGYRRFLAPQRVAIETLADLPGEWLDADDRRHLAAAADRAARMAEELEAIRERAALVHETLTDLRAEQIDTRSLIVSVAAMVFLPLTFITGFYGMNVKSLPYADEPWVVDAIMGACVVLTVGIVAFFSRRHWFGR